MSIKTPTFWTMYWLVKRRGCLNTSRRTSGKAYNGKLPLPHVPRKHDWANSNKSNAHLIFLIDMESSTKNSYHPDKQLMQIFRRNPHRTAKIHCTYPPSHGQQLAAVPWQHDEPYSVPRTGLCCPAQCRKAASFPLQTRLGPAGTFPTSEIKIDDQREAPWLSRGSSTDHDEKAKQIFGPSAPRNVKISFAAECICGRVLFWKILIVCTILMNIFQKSPTTFRAHPVHIMTWFTGAFMYFSSFLISLICSPSSHKVS